MAWRRRSSASSMLCSPFKPRRSDRRPEVVRRRAGRRAVDRLPRRPEPPDAGGDAGEDGDSDDGDRDGHGGDRGRGRRPYARPSPMPRPGCPSCLPVSPRRPAGFRPARRRCRGAKAKPGLRRGLAGRRPPRHPLARHRRTAAPRPVARLKVVRRRRSPADVAGRRHLPRSVADGRHRAGGDGGVERHRWRSCRRSATSRHQCCVMPARRGPAPARSAL